MKRLILPITALFLSAAPSDIDVALPEIIELNEHISYRVKWESWIVSKEFVRMDSLTKDSLHWDAVDRLRIIELNYKP